MPVQRVFFIFLFAFFVPLYLLRLNQIPEYKIPATKPVKLIGRVSQQPYLKGSQQIIKIGPVLIKTGRFPGYFYGQKLEVVGKFTKKVINPFKIQYLAYYPALRVLDKEENFDKTISLRQILFNIRGHLEEVIGQFLPEPQSSLLNGIFLGAKREMPQKFWQNLRETGTLHVVVASGQNVSMVAKFLIAFLVLVVNRKKALVIAILGVALYVLMVGAEPPVLRAGAMALLAYLAQTLGREEEGTIALLLAAAIILLISPLILFDIGFQLSFMATAGILWFYPLLVGSGMKIFSLPVFGEALATTIAAQLAVTPLILTNFGQLSFLSPLINALVLWVVPIVMVLGSAVAALGLIIKPLAQVLSWFVWVLLTYFVKVIEIFGSLPWASFKISKLSVWWAIGYYLVLGIVIFRYNDKTRSCRIDEAKIKR